MTSDQSAQGGKRGLLAAVLFVAALGGTPTAQVTQAAPVFDEVRRAPDGLTVIAGQAAPGSTLDILLDGNLLQNVSVDRTGRFATLVQVPHSGPADSGGGPGNAAACARTFGRRAANHPDGRGPGADHRCG